MTSPLQPAPGLAVIAVVASASAVVGYAVAWYTLRPATAPEPELVTTAHPEVAAAAPAELPAATAAPTSFADVVELAIPAVVGITSTERTGDDGLLARFRSMFRGHPEINRQSAGTGFVVSASGYIITNHHVIEDADAVQVETFDGRELTAEVVGADPETDLALLKVPAESELAPLPLGDSDRLRVGDWVAAIGNPLMYDHTVTVGVVSAKGRRLTASAFDSYLQTDAAINVGNSGGPLLNLHGEVVGINTAIASQGQNIGFAVPVNTAVAILPALKSRGRVARGFLGVSIDPVESDHVVSLGLDGTAGALISRVEPGEAGDRAGLKPGDVVLEVDGHKVDDPTALVQAIAACTPGQEVRLRIRRDGEDKGIRARLGERKRADAAPRPARLGIDARPADDRLRSRFGIDEEVSGLVVTEVDNDGPSADLLEPGDVLLEIDRAPVRTRRSLARALAEKRAGDDVLLYLWRDGRRFFLTVETGG